MWIQNHLEFYPAVYSEPHLCPFPDVSGCVHPGLLVQPESGTSELLFWAPWSLDQLGESLNQLHPDQCGLPERAPQVVRPALFPDNYRGLSPPRNEGQDGAQLLLQCQGNYEEFAPTHICQSQRGRHAVGRGNWLFQWLLGGNTLSSLELWRNSCPWDILWRARSRRAEVSRR